MTNRTLQFCGYAYGTEPVQLIATIDGQEVFNGTVDTLNQPMPTLDASIKDLGAPTLFSVVDSSLFTTDFLGSYPMLVTVASGSGIVLQNVNSNYMWNQIPVNSWASENSSISGTTLTIGNLVDNPPGWITTGAPQIGDLVLAPNVIGNTQITGGSGSTWTVNLSQEVPTSNIRGATFSYWHGNATSFLSCYNGTPTNSEGTPDPRSSVTIDGITQVPPLPPSSGTWIWEVYQGSTLACNLNVSVGNVKTA